MSDHIWRLDTVEDAVAFLLSTIDGATQDDGMSKREREGHYGKMPHGTLTPDEMASIKEAGEALKFSVGTLRSLLRGYERTLPKGMRDERGYWLSKVVLAAFQIGQLTQYNPIVQRWAVQKSRKQTAAGRKKRASTEEIVRAALQKHRAKNPNSRSQGNTLIDLIMPAVNESLEAIGRSPIKESAMRKQLAKIRKAEQRSADYSEG